MLMEDFCKLFMDEINLEEEDFIQVRDNTTTAHFRFQDPSDMSLKAPILLGGDMWGDWPKLMRLPVMMFRVEDNHLVIWVDTFSK